MTPEETAIRQHLQKSRPYESACGCMGPQGNDPVCPCEMRWVEFVEGNYYRIKEQRSPNGITLSAERLEPVVNFQSQPQTLWDRLAEYKAKRGET